MRIWAKFAFIAAAPLLLTACLWSPGKFNSTLALNKSGTFTLDYKGEIVLQLPKDRGSAETWNPDAMVRCHRSGTFEVFPDIAGLAGDDARDPVRPCTSDETASAKTQFEKGAAERAARKRADSEQMAKLFGLPGSDDESNRAFAAKLMKYQGWRAVTYKGKGLFEVDYHFEGRTGQDFAFPLMPESDMIIPFVTIRRRSDGAVMVTAPAFTGGAGPLSARAKMLGLPDKGGDGPRSQAEGRFTIITDGEILTNNSEDGPQPHAAGRQMHWDVGAASTKIPEMLVRL